MSVSSTLLRLRSSAAPFGRAKDGNVAVIFALALIPMLGLIGAAVDYTRATKARTSMQTALDSAALMVAADVASGKVTGSNAASAAQTYFTGLYTGGTDAGTISISAAYTAKDASGNSTIVLTGSGSVATDFMNVLGFSTIPISSSSTTTWGGARLRVALALDNTGSMADNGKITALITASKNLITQLSASATNNGDVYVSITPFANVVKIGTSLVSNSLIDWSNWSTSGSIEEGWTCGSSYSSRNKTMLCGTANNNTSNWNGCVMDRNQDYDISIAAATSSATYYPADQSSYCPQQITPLSYDWTALKNSISAMTPSGGTNQPIGLVWAWQTLQQSAPFNAPAMDSNYVYRSAIILLSDGLNTMDRWPAYGNGSQQFNGSIDARQKKLCDAIKAAGVTIYTIQVNTGGDATSTVLQYCASGSSNFFLLTSADQVITTFNTIGSQLNKLRISK